MQIPNEVWIALIAAIAWVLGWILPSPRSIAQAGNERLRELEVKHYELEKKHIESNATLRSAVTALGVQISELSSTIKELTRRMDQHNVR